MTGGALTAIIAVAAVAALGLLLRRSSEAPPAATGSPAPPPPPDDDAEDDEGSAGTVALTSDGWSFVPMGDRDKVRLIPPPVAEDSDPAAGRAAVEHLGRGDLIAARVRRGAPDHDPWRLEALGRDYEYRAWRFETEDAAHAALELVTGRVVRPPRDEDGEAVTIGEEDFAEARRREAEIEAELANMPDVESDR